MASATDTRAPGGQGAAEFGLDRPKLNDGAAETISGSVERVTFHNEENGYCVLRVNARGVRGLATVVGYAGAIAAGEWVTATGDWINDAKYGLQFKARLLRSSAPTSVAGIRAYLGSGMIRGIGKFYAGKLVDEFGTRVFEVIEQEPERLKDVEGVGPVRAQSISDAWQEQRALRDIMVFLHSHGVGTSRAVRIFKTYGDHAVEIISDNPYRLAKDIWGIGFRTADAIAQKLGIEANSMVRVRAGIEFVLSEATDDGNLGLQDRVLVERAQSVLEVDETRVQHALQQEVQEGEIVIETVDGVRCAFLAWCHHIERVLAERIKEITAHPVPWRDVDSGKALAWVAEKAGIEFSEGQRDAIRLAVKSKLTVVTGGPGVGKTTITNSILRILAAIGARIQLCAPTGRAAKKLSEATGREAVTIHRLLAVDPATGRFRYNSDNTLECDLVVVDETSMVDAPLMNALVSALPASAALMLVGDIDQLPSVGPGRVLADLIESEAVPVVRLKHVFRQAAESRIIVNAHRINAGKMPDLSAPRLESDFYFVKAEDPESAAAAIRTLVCDRIPGRFGFDPVNEIQVLSPMNRGRAGVRSLNEDLQAALNPDGEPSIQKFGWKYATGDKVMQIRNDYEKSVFNGDIGSIRSVDPADGTMAVAYDGFEATYSFGELDSVVPAYAATVHKSQGSEYPAVVIPLLTQHFPMLQRNLLYTGITRGRRLVVLVGQKKAVAMAVRSSGGARRITRLKELLQNR